MAGVTDGAHAAIAAPARPSGRASATTAASPQSSPQPQPTRVRHSPEVQSPRQALLRGPVEPEQFTAVLFTKRCAKAGIEVSMGSVGDCYDNAVCETFHATLKKETDLPTILADPSRGAHRDLSVHRGLVQPAAPSLNARLPLPDRVRATPRRARPTRARGREFGQRIGRGRLAEGRRRAYNASHLDGRRRVGCPRPNHSRERPRSSNRGRLRPPETRSRDERPPPASPTGSHRTSSLIQTSTTTARRVVQTGGGPASPIAQTRACGHGRPDDRLHILGARRLAIGLPRFR